MSYVISVMKMSQKKRIGKKEKEVLDFLIRNNGTVWKSDILERFVYASRYTSIIEKRLYRMQEKGLIFINKEINPKTGREKQRVYLKQ